MQHIAIDLGGKKSQICIRDAAGAVLKEGRVDTAYLGSYLSRQAQSRVVMETCAEAFMVADAAKASGHEVRVVPATLVKTLGVGSRRTKTDKRDAQILSEVSCRIDLPTVHIPSAGSRAQKTQCGMREALVGARTQLINTVRGYLRAQAIRIRNGAAHTFAIRVREQMTERGCSMPDYVERQLITIVQLSEQIKAANEELKQTAAVDPVCQRLMSVPGVGVVTAVRYRAAIDDVTRFSGAHEVQSYLGLVPGQRSSSEKIRHIGITKAGSTQLRVVLVQAAWAARRCAPKHPMVQWCMAIEQRRGKHIAVMALVRKMAGILYALWKHDATYQPQRGAQQHIGMDNSSVKESDITVAQKRELVTSISDTDR